jgi:negative regulator of flagellin synthesis FlgM
MIDGLGRASLPRLAIAGNEASGRATSAAGTMPAPRSVDSHPAQKVRDMAASPPVDSARVEALRLAIAAGSYTPDAEAIASAMLRLEAGSGR